MSENISLIIKTFERQDALERLLASIREQGYGHCPIFIADDSKTPYRDAILRAYGDLVDEYIVLPFDTGLSKGRNELLKCVDTKYFVLNDDDFVYEDVTNFRKAREELEQHGIDILCGYLLNKARSYHFPWLPRRVSNTLGLFDEFWEEGRWIADIQETQDGGISIQSLPGSPSPIQRCDLSFNFFIARTHKVRDIVRGWNEKLKTQEHWEFFYRCKKANLNVASSSSFGAYHVSTQNERYNRFRYDREDEMITKALKEHGFQYLQRGLNTYGDQHSE